MPREDAASDTAEAVIVVTGLVVRYGGFTAVDGVSFSVSRGELFGLLGPNGAGKTTTIRVLTGQLPPDGGTVRVCGLDAAGELPELKRRFGYVPDVDNHFEEFTGQQNLDFFCRLYDAPVSRIGECLAAVELEDERRLPVRHYSKGMKKKLLIARELLHEPAVLYLDEPTANLDVHSSRLVHGLLGRLAQSGTTVLLTTHNMKEVEQLCDRVAILRQGRLVDLDSPVRLTARNAERWVDVTIELDGEPQHESIDLNDPVQRERLAAWVRENRLVKVRSREFDFHEVFLKLTRTPPP